jgi:hypothetical protein
LSEAVGNDKTLVWTATDFAEGDPVEEVLAARFTSTQRTCSVSLAKVKRNV